MPKTRKSHPPSLKAKVKIGDNKYEQLRGVGGESRRFAVEQGASVGQKDYLGQIEAANNKAHEVSFPYEKQAQSIKDQGRVESIMLVNQAWSGRRAAILGGSQTRGSIGIVDFQYLKGHITRTLQG
jgi:hypothetical protein